MQEECWIADLGADAVYHSSESQLWGNRDNWRIEQQPRGSGPRFLEIHPLGKIVYLVTELSNELIVLEKNSDGGLKEKQRAVCSLPEHEKVFLQFCVQIGQKEDCS